jgi:hypothetical protein
MIFQRQLPQNEIKRARNATKKRPLEEGRVRVEP